MAGDSVTYQALCGLKGVDYIKKMFYCVLGTGGVGFKARGT